MTLLLLPVADPGGDLGEPRIPPFQASYTSSIVVKYYVAHSVDLLEPPSLRSQAFLSLDAAISLPLARFMIENRRRTSAETQKRLVT